MSRKPRPWRRTSVAGAWYAQVDGKKVWLAPPEATPEQAQQALEHRLAELNARAGPQAPRVGGLIALFLEDVRARVGRGELRAVTLEGYRRWLRSADASVGRVLASKLQQRHVDGWLDRNPRWGDTSRRNAAAALRAALNWAALAGHAPAGRPWWFRVPAASPADRRLTRPQVQLISLCVRDDAFRDLLLAVSLTGLPPGQVYALTAGDVDPEAGTWRVAAAARGAGRSRTRVVRLNEAGRELTRRLLNRHPEGLLFRNSQGNPWTRHAVANRLERLCSRVGVAAGFCVSALRGNREAAELLALPPRPWPFPSR